MAIRFRNLVFEGGGARGSELGGALGCLHAERLPIVRSADFAQFPDDSFDAIRAARRLAKEFGPTRGDLGSGWMEEAWCASGSDMTRQSSDRVADLS